MLPLVALLAALAGAAVAGAAVWWWFARQVRASARRLDAYVVPAEAGVDHALARVERAVVRAREETARAHADAERLRIALDALPHGVVLTGATGDVVVRNVAAAGFVGTRTADALVDDAVRSVLRQATGDGPVARILEVFGPPRRTIEITAVPLAGGGAVVEIEDVTERARLEAVRTDFVANISHELKTPIGAIALLAETLEDETDPDLVHRLSSKILDEAHRVARIIEDLLELSRIELGEAPVREEVNVGLVAAEAWERVRFLADSKGIGVRVEEPSRRMTVVGDRRQLVSALSNLIENGIKYSDAGSAVEVAARTDGSWVELTVTDHGIGIPARDLDRVFERFYRVDRARSRETGGTGLGLAIVRHVATNHGGTVSVRSTEGAGSTFMLRLPAGPGPVAITMPEAG